MNVTYTLPYPLTMSAREKRARDAVRHAVRHYAALPPGFPMDERKRYEAMERAQAHLARVQLEEGTAVSPSPVEESH